jgi:predicted aldo/keto reductase-like oxidoreductase
MSSESPQVEYRRLGKSGLRVSVPILGAMSFGNDQWAPWVIKEAEALPLLEAAWKRGVTYVNMYLLIDFGPDSLLIQYLGHGQRVQQR